jgi:hypothetical protein
VAPYQDLSTLLTNLVKGYPRLAGCMTFAPKTTLFRYIHTLNNWNLICIQAELYYLEELPLKTKREDSESKEIDTRYYTLTFHRLAASFEQQSHKQLDLITAIKFLLK